MRRALPGFPWQPARGIPKLNINIPIKEALAAVVPKIRTAREFVLQVQSYAVQLRQDKPNSRILPELEQLRDSLIAQQSQLDQWVVKAKTAGEDSVAISHSTAEIGKISDEILEEKASFDKLRESAHLIMEVEPQPKSDVVAPVVSEPPVPEPPDPDVQFKLRLKELLLRIQGFKADDLDYKKQMAKLATDARAVAQKQDFVAANGLLDKVDKLLVDHAELTKENAEHFATKMTQLKPRITNAANNTSPHVAELAKFIKQAAKLKSGDNYVAALNVLGEVEKLLDVIESAGAPVSPASALPTIPADDFVRLQGRWRDAQASAAKQLEDLGKQILQLPDVQNDSRFSEVKQVVDRLPQLIPNLEMCYITTWIALLKVERMPRVHQQNAISTINTYLKQLAASTVLQELAVFAKKNFNVQLSSATDLETALREVETELTTSP